MKSTLVCIFFVFIAVIAAQEPTCRNGAIGCVTDADCISNTDAASYCLNQPPHQAPFVCQGCPPNTGCCPGCMIASVGCTTDADCISYTSPTSYCMNQEPHQSPYVCHGCNANTGCCAL